ncbi:hypothetical protein [Corynebacterium cystitidis]|uniref:hypothetical protein n=1 Tax=Corynebacterium cystitidis TaxID=35757 RepID=UPI00211E57EB|nr:hypothetical protein [Corynebacterium cystitidis]
MVAVIYNATPHTAGSRYTTLKDATPNPRWMDQKVTYDNCYVIAQAIDIAFPQNSTTFTASDLLKDKALNHSVTTWYGKPSMSDVSASNEYDKFIGQMLSMMTFAGILKRTKSGRGYIYQVNDRQLLREMSSTEIQSLNLLTDYLEACLTVFGWWHNVETYLESEQSKEDMSTLKEKFVLLGVNTLDLGKRGGKNPEVEAARIFAKVINPIALRYGAHGVERGYVMRAVPSRNELTYNRPNFRDVASKKPRKLTRKVYDAQLEAEAQKYPDQANVSSMMRKVRNYHAGVSEVFTLSCQKATHIHHMFPQSRFPKLRDTLENLIALTPGQHLGEAHPNGNTHDLCPIFQKAALHYKLESVIRSEECGDGMYSMENFARVLEIGFGQFNIEPTEESCKLAIAQA